MTISDIAARFGTSNATVSKALNGSTDISAEKKKLICDYAESVGYHSRKSQAISGRLALLYAEPLSSAKREIMSAFCEEAHNARYVVEETPLSQIDDVDEHCARNRYAGGFLIGGKEGELRLTEQCGHPFVLTETYRSELQNVAGVGSDHLRAAREAVDYLVARGHTRIAYFGDPKSLVGAERLAGYLSALAGHGISFRGEDVYLAAQNRTDLDGQVTAAIFADETLSAPAAETLEKALADGLCVVAFAENAPGRTVNVRQDFSRIGKLAFRSLMSLMGGTAVHRVMVPCTLCAEEEPFRQETT